MSSRKEKLWRAVVPDRTPCPQASRRRVLRRLSAAEPLRPLRLHRAVRRAAAAAAALALLTVTAAGGALSEYSVFSGMFREPSDYALSLVDMEPKSVSNNGYTLTVTSSVADDSEALFTLEIRPETEEARAFLSSEDFGALTASERVRAKAGDYGLISLTASWIGWESLILTQEDYSPETDSVRVEVGMDMGPGLWRQISVHLNTMDDDVWLRFGVNRAPSATVTLSEAGEEPGLYKVRLSPLSVWMEYVVEETEEEPSAAGGGMPMPHVSALWEDGTLTDLWELETSGGGGSGSSADGRLWRYRHFWRFSRVQDFGRVTAIVCGGAVYPLDGGESYALEQG